ncbi:hypothetical protein [Aquimarina litoralis]|uniref:hypothetical protein n=1 Tax=Aquimarina litoralis TaxID=584605 RepID=UPI001C59A905|nr:hypothetical protein [Aquimarina litoralis]MBW1299012.1 hypothetical protein [Aquimarina litoralis]
MKKIIVSLLLIISFTATAQFKEGQNFCDESKDKSYFPLALNEKKIFWADTYYTEIKKGTKEIDGKVYIEFHQKWKNNTVVKLYLREENGIVYQYEECCEQETIRYDPNFLKGYTWNTADGLGEYQILSYKGKLKTPFCKYGNLMVIQANLKSGKYKFYYRRGHGYVGATFENEVISCVTPTFDLD